MGVAQQDGEMKHIKFWCLCCSEMLKCVLKQSLCLFSFVLFNTKQNFLDLSQDENVTFHLLND